MKWIPILLATCMLVSAKDIELSKDEAQSIKTYTPTKFIAESPGIPDGTIVKLQFTSRYGLTEYSADFFSSSAWDDENRVSVRVPNSVRGWFLKIPETGSRKTSVFAAVRKSEPSFDVVLELVGAQLDIGFKGGVIRWSGQQGR